MPDMNPKKRKAMKTGVYYCRECGAIMEWEGEPGNDLLCPKCGFSQDFDHYGFDSDEEYDALFPSIYDALGIDEELDIEDDYEYDSDC